MAVVDRAKDLAAKRTSQAASVLHQKIEGLGWIHPLNPSPEKMLECLDYVNGEMRVNRLSFGFKQRDGREAGDISLYREGVKLYARIAEKTIPQVQGPQAGPPFHPGSAYFSNPKPTATPENSAKAFTIEL